MLQNITKFENCIFKNNATKQVPKSMPHFEKTFNHHRLTWFRPVSLTIEFFSTSPLLGGLFWHSRKVLSTLSSTVFVPDNLQMKYKVGVAHP